MRRGTIKSELIKSLGHGTVGKTPNVLEVEYAADGAIFQYFGVSESLFRALVRSLHPGEDWLALRDDYDYKCIRKGTPPKKSKG